MSPGAEDMTSSPEPSTEQDAGTMAEDKTERASTEEKSPMHPSHTGNAAKNNAKDPSRPRRKKARRACFACQRAHLTCGDERPCLRCIKRGLQDQCHDGVRKKAKYLHDAPAEALMPGFGHNYHMNGSQSMPAVPNVAAVSPNHVSVSQAPNYYVPTTPHHYPQYGPTNQPGSMGPPSIDSSSNLVHPEYAHHNVDTPIQYPTVSSQQISPAQELGSSLDPPGAIGGGGGHSFDQSFIDPNDASMFNFNVSELNFGNHYGALEFGMLGHMSSGAVHTPDVEAMNQLGHPHHGSVSYDGQGSYPTGMGYNQGYQSWQIVPNAGSRHNSVAQGWGQPQPGLEAFAIGEHPPSLSAASPHSQGDSFPGYQSPDVSPETQFAQPEQSQHPDLLRQSLSQQQARKQATFPGDVGVDALRRRPRTISSEIYTSIKAPYSYTQGFHALIAYLQKRFSQNTVVRIARALAKVRPSFISCNKGLNREDLIFMEKGLQRTLCEYEDFLSLSGTPTVICRRTGEIAYASKEFCLVTGWRRDVLLGKEPNLNVNTGVMSSGTHTGSSTRGAATPRIPPNVETDPGRTQPVFLAELLDDDSVVQFYENFAELAFGASRTSMIGLSCSIFKYRTKHDVALGPDDSIDDGKRIKQPSSSSSSSGDIKSEAGMFAIGDRSGRVECAMCWTVKRDMFDNPSLIVINLLPMI